jgi:hypothetical protein
MLHGAQECVGLRLEVIDGDPRESGRRLAAQLPPARIRWERDAELHFVLLSLGCSLICWRHIRPWPTSEIRCSDASIARAEDELVTPLL